MASERTSTTCVPGSKVSGTCAIICPLEVDKSGTDTSPKVTHEPPRMVGAGVDSAVAAEARFWPVMVMNEPGWMLVVLPSLELTIPREALMVGTVFEPVVVSGITLSPESVMA